MKATTFDVGGWKVLCGAAALAAWLVGCGPAENGGPDASVNDPDGGVQTDGGVETDAGVEPELDVAVARLNTDGTLDTTFGNGGVAYIDFDADETDDNDSVWSIDVDAQDRVVLFGSKRGAGDRVDNDRVVARLTADGEIDATFAADGLHILNIAGLSDNARNGFVQPDGKILAAGYTSQPTGVGTQSANRIVLLRLNEDGSPDQSFGVDGVVNSNPFVPQDPVHTPWGMAEAYAAGLLSNGTYVTTGYGRSAASGPVDLVSFAYGSNGDFDDTWGNNGSFVLDIAGDNDRGRNLAVLPDDRILMVGSGSADPGDVDAMLVMLNADGTPDDTFGTDGHSLFEFGRADEAFFGVAVSPSGDWAAAVGYAAGAMEDDDALLAIIPLDGDAPTVEVKALSDTDDRLWAAAFDGSGRLYAAGFVAEGEESRMVVVRFNADGSLDSAFGNGGIATLEVSGAARGIAVQSDGKIVVAGAAARP